MSNKRQEDISGYPKLGQMFHWVDRPGNATKLVRILIGLCIVVFLLNFTYSGKGHYSAENIPGFYAAYGFIAFTFIIFAAKALRTLIKRPENYYGKKVVDAEEYPDAELEKIDHVD